MAMVSHIFPTHCLEEDDTEQDLFCAEILASMEFSIRKKIVVPGSIPFGEQSKIMKRERTIKVQVSSPTSAFKRNINACIEHRRKHQKCPLDCSRRIERESQMEEEEEEKSPLQKIPKELEMSLDNEFPKLGSGEGERSWSKISIAVLKGGSYNTARGA